MRKVVIGLLILSVVLLLFVFQKLSYSDTIDAALKQAGSNKTELKRVLDHYGNEKDSLKYKAAVYLITNMYEHHSADIGLDRQLVNNLDQVIKSSNEDYKFRANYLEPIAPKTWDSLKVLAQNVPLYLSNLDKKQSNTRQFYDLVAIESDWLINHIERSFKVWENSFFASNMGFDEFCETLLRYRYFKEELRYPDGYNRKFLVDLMAKNQSTKNLSDAIDSLNLYLSRIRYLNVDFKDDLGWYNILKWESIECDEQSIIAAGILNESGIPTAIDFTAEWLDRDARHTWCSVRDTSGIYHPFSPQWQKLDDTEVFKLVSKVYRRTYAYQQESPMALKQEQEEVPPIFKSPNILDVTDQYHKVCTIKIDAKVSPDPESLSYLAIFNPQGWTSVGWGSLNKTKDSIIFENVPQNIVYVVGSYVENKIEPFTEPFYLDQDGAMHKIAVKPEGSTNLLLTEKYPRKAQLRARVTNMKGAVFQGANKADFSDAVTLYEIDSIPKPYVKQVNIETKGKYRYTRFLPPKGQLVNMAIIEYVAKRTDKEESSGTLPYILQPSDNHLLDYYKSYKKILGKPIGKPRTIKRLESAFDGNMETYSDYRSAMLDFGEAKKIDAIRFAPINANNMINIGDTYELMYYNNGWKSRAKKVAKYNYLYFQYVPEGTLYWLKNLTKGKEELSFMHFDDQQIFVNYDDLENHINLD